jgi:hypothetical protein
VEDVGYLCSSEQEVTSEIIAVANADAASPAGCNEIRDKVTVRKLWKLCRAYLDRQAKESDIGISMDAPMAPVTVRHIKDAWFLRHNFNLPNTLLLISQLQARLHRELLGTPRALSIILPSTMRTLSCTDPGSKQVLVKTAAGQLETQTEVNDQIRGLNELYQRLRAFLFTVSYVTISEPTWFPYQSALNMSEHLFRFFYNRFDGQHAPLQYFTVAWASTCSKMSEAIRDGASLADFCAQTSAWEHLWIAFRPSGQARGHGKAGSGSHGIPDLPADLADKISRQSDLIARLQSEKDQANNRANRAEQRGGGGGGGGGKQQGKGKGKNKGAKKKPWGDLPPPPQPHINSGGQKRKR